MIAAAPPDAPITERESRVLRSVFAASPHPMTAIAALAFYRAHPDEMDTLDRLAAVLRRRKAQGRPALPVERLDGDRGFSVVLRQEADPKDRLLLDA